jgi:hypothetical protein
LAGKKKLRDGDVAKRDGEAVRSNTSRNWFAIDRDGDGARQPIMVVFSADPSVVKVLSSAVSDPWIVHHANPARIDPANSREVLLNPAVKTVIVDDYQIEESNRGWLLDQVRKLAPNALIAYIAALHSEEGERRARSYQVQYYTSRPLDHDRTLRMIRAFANAIR